MTKRGLIIVAGVILGVVLAQPSTAAERLYQAVEADGTQSIRLLPAQVSPLTLTSSERATLQPRAIYRAMYTPNDPQYVLQWNLQAMRVPQAWDVDQVSPIHGGDPRIVVAILDTGIALTSVGATASVPDILPTSI